jgi:hypothetical protein
MKYRVVPRKLFQFILAGHFLSGHPNPANDGHLKTGQRKLIPGR